MTATMQRGFAKEDLSTCPAELAQLQRGTCSGCGRPMVSKRRFSDTPALQRWFVRAGSSRLCTGCHVRERRTGDATPQPPAPRRRKVAPAPLATEELRALRLRHGACPECGWTVDASGRHVDRRCALARLHKRRGGPA